MRVILFITFLLITKSGYSQNVRFENSALSFYVDNIYNGIDKVMTDGNIRITRGESSLEAQFASIYVNYLFCKISNESNPELKKKIQDELDNSRWGSNTLNFDTLNLSELSININSPLIKVNNIKYQNLKGGVIGYLRDLGDKLNGERFYLEVYRYFMMNNSYYVLITVTKKDYEYTHEYYLKINSDVEVIDWCERVWVQ